jgi:malonyl-CoA/methylmalonyl-CoA synthetase
LKSGHDLTLDSCRNWAKDHLAVYKVPTRILAIEELPRNAMGKVTKPAVAQLFQTESALAE